MRIFITKYALTSGIEEIEVNKEDIENDGYVLVKQDRLPTFFRKNEWAKTKEEALEIAEEMRKNKIASLKKQIEKLKKKKIKIKLLDVEKENE